MKKLLLPITVAVFACLTTSCVPLLLGAAGGYIFRNEGYKVQNPLPLTGKTTTEAPEGTYYEEDPAPHYQNY